MPLIYECSTQLVGSDPIINNQGHGRIRCDGTAWTEYDPNASSFDPTTIDSEVATMMYTAGFLLFLTPWATAWGFRKLLQLLR